MDEKTCSRCKERHPISEFRFENIARGLRKSACRDCENRRMREDRRKHAEKRRATENRHYRRTADRTAALNLVRRYGISEAAAAEAVRIFECDLCGGSNKGERRLVLDHCHATGKNRGLLCDNCNLALGKLKDDPALIRRAAAYVEAGGSGRF